MTEVPAGPLIQALEQRRLSFISLKTSASALIVRKGRKRSFESIALLLKGQEKFKLEAYDPLGQPLVTLLWKGKSAALLRAGQLSVIESGKGLEQLVGAEVKPGELGALLSGNVPAISGVSESKAYCGQDGGCVLDMHSGKERRLVRVIPGAEIRVLSSELYREGTPVFRVRFSHFETISHYALPRMIVVENSDRKNSLTVELGDPEVNTPLDDGEFTASGMENVE